MSKTGGFMKKGTLVVVSACASFSLLALLASSACTRGSKNPSEVAAAVSVRFPIPIVEAGQTPFYVAQDNGYYNDEHLNVSFQMGSRELNPVKTVATGQDMFGVLGGPDTL